MSIEIRVPALPESIADATLVAWHKQPGEAFKRDENLADLETDKVVLEVPAPADGVMGEHQFEVGATVTEGQVLAQITPAPRRCHAAAATRREPRPPPPAAAKSAAPAETAKLSPSVRRLVEENKIDPAAVPGTGRDGRLTKSDVAGFLDKKPAPPPCCCPGAGCREARCGSGRCARRPCRAACRDEPAAATGCAAPGRGAVYPGFAHLIQ